MELHEELHKIINLPAGQRRVVIGGKEVYPNQSRLPVMNGKELVVYVRHRLLGGMYHAENKQDIRNVDRLDKNQMGKVKLDQDGLDN